MEIDASTRPLREQVASRDTALACLAQLGVKNGLGPAVAAAHRGDDSGGGSLPIARLIELAGDFGLQAEHARVDWQGLHTMGYDNPILVLLKNTNVAILTGGGRDGAEEVAVWDPLHRDSELLYVPRQEFERAWSGDVLRVTQQPSSTNPPSLELHAVNPDQPPATEKQQLSSPGQRLSLLRRCCLFIAAIVATAGGGLFLFGLPSPENFMSTGSSVANVPERVTEATQTKISAAWGRLPDQEVASVPPMPAPAISNPPESSIVAAGPTPSDEPVTDKASHIADLPPEPTSTAEVRASEPSPAASMSVAPQASDGAAAEPETASKPVIPPPDAALSAAEIAVLLARGDKSFSSGDVASARLYYGRAANAGDGQATLRLGETFDPVFLEHAHLRSARGDLVEALSWYRRARDMGVAEAAVLLNSLEAK
jgi:hypothetical protein